MRFAEEMPNALPRWFAVSLCVAAAACTDSIDGGSCSKDSDCVTGETCLVDLDRATSYCTALCSSDADCPSFQVCSEVQPRFEGRTVDQGQSRHCLDRVRECQETEICNGLDDDCDGVVDGPDCVPTTRCNDDDTCGGFVCQAPSGQPETICAPPSDGADELTPCTRDDECYNGVCETGFCSELCRPGSACPSIPAVLPDVDGTLVERDRAAFCAEAIGDSSRPRHNKCAIQCNTDRQCPDDLKCAWRGVHQGGDTHDSVCAILDPTRLPLGSACPDNTPPSDRMCQHGLCYFQTCTRPCGGFGSDCSDVGEDFSCDQIELFYGGQVFAGFFCTKDEG